MSFGNVAIVCLWWDHLNDFMPSFTGTGNLGSAITSGCGLGRFGACGLTNETPKDLLIRSAPGQNQHGALSSEGEHGNWRHAWLVGRSKKII